MTDTPHELYDERFVEMLRSIPTNLDSEAAKLAVANLKTFSDSRPPQPEPQPTPDPVPTTIWGKTKALVGKIYESETTRVIAKVAGGVGTTGLVVWATIHRDAVIDRQALQQANQRND